MNAPGEDPRIEKEKKEKEQGRSRVWLYILIGIFLAVVVFLAPVLRDMRPVKIERPSVPPVQSVVQEAPLEKLEKSKPDKEDKKEETARLRNELTALSEAMNVLQAQVKQTAQSAEKTHSASRNRLAMTIAFTQIKAATMSGQSFAREWEVLKRAAAQDGALAAAALQIEPIAATGAPTLPDLREAFENLEGAMRLAVNRASAQNWKERILAELKSLIDIRKINGATKSDDASEAIRRDLEQGRLKEALEKAEALPESARAILKEWREKAQARQRLEAALDAIAEHLIAQTEGDVS